jgi:hypothetical protein
VPLLALGAARRSHDGIMHGMPRTMTILTWSGNINRQQFHVFEALAQAQRSFRVIVAHAELARGVR